MDDELKKLMEENLELSQENNEMLKKQMSALRWSRFFKITYWTVIIALTLGAYYYTQPVIDSLKESYGATSQSIGDVLRNLNQFNESVGGMLK